MSKLFWYSAITDIMYKWNFLGSPTKQDVH